jgi:hypothetical protein
MECDAVFNHDVKFCYDYDGKVYDKCGGKPYAPNNQFCLGGNIYNKCGINTYNPETQRCGAGNILETKCGTDYYNPATHFCSGNTMYGKCGGNSYTEPANKFCYEGTVYNKCGVYEYDPSKYICSGDVAYRAKCDGIEYNPLTQRCLNDIIENKCGNSSSSQSSSTRCKDSQNRELFCSWTSGCYAIDPAYAETPGQTCSALVSECEKNASLFTGPSVEGAGIKCAAPYSYYNPATHFCSNNTVYPKCGGIERILLATEFCFNGKIYNKCNGNTYNPERITCENGTMSLKSGNKWIKCIGGFGSAGGKDCDKAVALNVNECVEIDVIDYGNQDGTLPTLKIPCDAGGPSSISVTITLNGIATTATGSTYVRSIVNLAGASLYAGNYELGTLCLTTLSGATNFSCKLEW